MDKLCFELFCMICELLHPSEIACIAATSKSHRAFEEFLYQRHAYTSTHSAAIWALERVGSKGISEELAKSILVKAERYCGSNPENLNMLHKLEFFPSYVPPNCEPIAPCYPSYEYGQVLMKPCQERPALAPLHLAAWRGLDTIVEWLLDHGAIAHLSTLVVTETWRSVSTSRSTELTTERTELTPLYMALCSMALCRDHVSTVRLLIARPFGAKLSQNYTGTRTTTALHLASGLGLTDVARVLLTSGNYKGNDLDSIGHSALSSAIRHRETALIKLLIDSGPDVSSTDLRAALRLGLSMNNLAFVPNRQGEHEDAEAMHREDTEAEREGARTRASEHAHPHKQPGLSAQEPGEIRRDGDASEGTGAEGECAGAKASVHSPV
jgi:hypothetical protein